MGRLKELPAFPDDVNDWDFVSIQNFVSYCPGNSKVKNGRRCYHRESRKQYLGLHLLEAIAMLHYSKWTLLGSVLAGANWN